MGSTGISAVKAPILVEPYPTAAVSRRLAKVQFKESIPWLRHNQYRDIGALGCVYHVLKKFSQRARGAGSARLLSVDVVHGGVPAGD